MADAAELAAHLHNYPDIEFSALVASPNGAKRAVAAGLGSIEYVVAARRRIQQGQRRAHQRTRPPASRSRRSVAIAHNSDVTVEVIVATAWDCPFEGPTPPRRVLEISRHRPRSRRRPVSSIADTIGTTTPRRVSSLIAELHPVIGDMPLGGHFHNTRGAGLACAYAAVGSGSHQAGRPRSAGSAAAPFAPGATGNIATEDLVYLLRDSDIDVDVDLQAAIAAAITLRNRLVGHDLPEPLCCAPATGFEPGCTKYRPKLLTAERPPDQAGHRAGRPQTVRRTGLSRHHAGRHHIGRGEVAGGVLPLLRGQRRLVGRPGGVVPARRRSAVRPESAATGRRAESPDDNPFFTSVVTGYWNIFKQNIGIMIAVAQLAATQQRFAAVQNEFRLFGMNIVAASVRRAQEQGYGTELNPEHTAAAIALLFENFTTVFVGSRPRPCRAGSGNR